MMARRTRVVATLAVTLTLVGCLPTARAQEPPPGEAAPPQPEEEKAVERTPPRLSFVHGAVSFWRPGAQDWTPAQVNTPLAPGDALYTGAGASLELQIDAGAFVRAGASTQLGLENQEPDFLQFKVTAGHSSLDLRARAPGHTIEIDTPNAAFTVDATGYYRVDVTNGATAFITRRGGRATVIPAGGEPSAIAPNEEVMVQGTDDPSVTTYVAPEVDAWDRWNYARTDHIIDAVSTRYVPSGVYGLDGLDRYGTWRVLNTYGPVWIPSGVAPGWAPYTAGRWIWDPYYGWTWVDAAPWGWAPYHYGRWVYVGRFWAWAPGPLVVRPVYAPALVAFFGGPQFGISIGLGVPAVGWCALGWGEPLIPWWGRHVGAPWWGGWGGPHVVNNVVINRTDVVNVTNITVYRNEHVRDAVVAVPADRFGRGGFAHVRVRNIDPRQLEPVRGRLDVRPVPASLAPALGRARRPPERISTTPVVATRAPRDTAENLRTEGVEVHHTAPPPRVVAAPSVPQSTLAEPRPPFGRQGTAERPRPPLPPRFEAPRQPGQGAVSPGRWLAKGSQGGPIERQPASPLPGQEGAIERQSSGRRGGLPVAPPAVEHHEPAPAPVAHERVPQAPRSFEPRRPAPAPIRGVPEAQAPSRPHSLPGEPANRLYQGAPPQVRGPRGATMAPGPGNGVTASGMPR